VAGTPTPDVRFTDPSRTERHFHYFATMLSSTIRFAAAIIGTPKRLQVQENLEFYMYQTIIGWCNGYE
jgi:hypothetical protein